MEKFIKNVKIINKNVNNKEAINGLKILIENYKKIGDMEKVKFFEKELENLMNNNINNNENNFIKIYIEEVEKNKDKFPTSSIPVKIDNETKDKFKEIAKNNDIKQGELFGALIKYFVDEYCKRYPEDCK
jgi:hypothetical protein